MPEKARDKSGWSAWKFSLKLQYGNYCQKLHITGCPELTVNCNKRSRVDGKDKITFLFLNKQAIRGEFLARYSSS